jgi:hypothetical protein
VEPWKPEPPHEPEQAAVLTVRFSVAARSKECAEFNHGSLGSTLLVARLVVETFATQIRVITVSFKRFTYLSEVATFFFSPFQWVAFTPFWGKLWFKYWNELMMLLLRLSAALAFGFAHIHSTSSSQLHVGRHFLQSSAPHIPSEQE